VSRVSGLVVWKFMCDNFGDLEMMNVQSIPSGKKNTCCICGASGFLGRGYWKIEYITLIDPALNRCPVFERNHVKLLNRSL
jgi:hypothetical protein